MGLGRFGHPAKRDCNRFGSAFGHDDIPSKNYDIVIALGHIAEPTRPQIEMAAGIATDRHYVWHPVTHLAVFAFVSDGEQMSARGLALYRGCSENQSPPWLAPWHHPITSRSLTSFVSVRIALQHSFLHSIGLLPYDFRRFPSGPHRGDR
jgi:hypothetical protein